MELFLPSPDVTYYHATRERTIVTFKSVRVRVGEYFYLVVLLKATIISQMW